MEKINAELLNAVKNGLRIAEDRSELVVTTSIIDEPAQLIAECVMTAYSGLLTPDEISAVSNLIFHALEDKRFFDWEMPTLCGLDKKGFESVLNKLRSVIVT